MQVLQFCADPMQNQAHIVEIPSKSYIANPMPVIGKSYTNPVELAQIIANPQKASPRYQPGKKLLLLHWITLGSN